MGKQEKHMLVFHVLSKDLQEKWMFGQDLKVVREHLTHVLRVLVIWSSKGEKAGLFNGAEEQIKTMMQS